VAKHGKRVVRLKGGDPLIFGRASEEIAACREANLSVEVVPGISAAQGVAAKLGLSLTDRKHSRRLQYVTWPAPGSEDTELGVLMEPEVGHGAAEVYTRVQA
jgi:uroporphyrin-III C-methyltransferase/precorrin-2 dehydrogenase/sirohydrochlorin ferrochelatase